jgi:hypothetical protein
MENNIFQIGSGSSSTRNPIISLSSSTKISPISRGPSKRFYMKLDMTISSSRYTNARVVSMLRIG